MVVEIKGIKLDTFPLKNLTKVADLIYFDGPLLSHFKNEYGDNYFYYWCDVNENFNRWLIFRVADKSLNGYLSGAISLRELIEKPSDGFVYLVDIDDDLEFHNLQMVQDLSDDYLPEADSYFDRSLSEIDYGLISG